MSRTVDVTGGEKVLCWVRVTEKTGADLAADQVRLSLTGRDGEYDWLVPDQTEQVSSSVVRAALLIDDRFDVGRYLLLAQVSDNPEVEIVRPANAVVTVR